MHFGEYELFPSLIGLSPLPTVHPKTFQRLLVRSSTSCYRGFNLTMGRSQGFASTSPDYGALFRLAFASAARVITVNLAKKSNSQAHYAKGTPSSNEWTPTACKRMVSGSISPRYSRYFSPFLHSTCSLSVSQQYLALPDGAGRFRRDFSGPALLRILLGIYNFPLRGSHPLWLGFPTDSCSLYKSTLQSYNPTLALTDVVWASPRSLATTCGITIVFSSSGYLDVSVLRVSLPNKLDIIHLQCTGLSHSEIYGSICMCQSPQLIAAYHVLHRL